MRKRTHVSTPLFRGTGTGLHEHVGVEGYQAICPGSTPWNGHAELAVLGKKVKADEVHASIMAALGCWYAKLSSTDYFVAGSRGGG